MLDDDFLLPSMADLRIALLNARQKEEAVAYFHSLGFVHIALPSATGRKLRAHIWRDRTPATQPGEGIHNHSFRFSSLVLEGVIQHQPFKINNVPFNRAGAMPLYEVIQEGQHTRLIDTGRRIRAMPETAQSYGAGESYSFPAGDFHTSQHLGSGRAITILCCEKVENSVSYMVGDKGSALRSALRKKGLPQRQILGLLDAVEAALDRCEQANGGLRHEI
ncbi:MAG: hypothetical protein ABIO86_12170 [Sphingomonas sp.]